MPMEEDWHSHTNMNPLEAITGKYNFDSAQFSLLPSTKMDGDIIIEKSGFIPPSRIRFGKMLDHRAFLVGYATTETLSDEQNLVLNFIRYDLNGNDAQIAFQVRQPVSDLRDISGLYRGDAFQIGANYVQHMGAHDSEAQIRSNLGVLLERLQSETTFDRISIGVDLHKPKF